MAASTLKMRCLRHTLFLVLFLLPVAAWAQFSPGALSKPHHALDGPTHCTACHLAGGGSRKFQCLSCHVEIRQSLAAQRGWHPSLVGKGRADDSCAKCHSEHNSENFVPIRWDVSIDEFDHRKTGYPLEGGHARLKCDQCHNPERISAAARKTILMKNLKRTYFGLNAQCLTCHEDEHRGQLGEKCERCHTVGRWKDTAAFDHATAKFRLTGAHEKTACAKCHPTVPAAGGGKPHVQYTGIAFAQCGACHKDPHRGAFSAPCSSCHGDVAWKPARNVTGSFDHSRTRYPLAGVHQEVACAKCHPTSDYKAPVAHQRCDACHRDIHGGQFATRMDRGECGACHTVDGWKKTTYTAASHAASAYPLTGRHAAVECAKCHVPAGAATKYKVAYARCIDCHRDPHDGQFVTAKGGNRCEDCHTVRQFQPAQFTLARHEKSRFPLQGAHAAVACGDCHATAQIVAAGLAAKAGGRYRFADMRCTVCHADPHQGQFRDARCESCHNVEIWRDVTKFDHAATRYALTGAHRAVACEKCHRATALSTGLQRVQYREAPLACAGCHEDIHRGQFATASGNAECAPCHDTKTWKAGAFDHNRTAFSLGGSHAQVPCRDCHSTRREVEGRSVLFYKPTPKECSSCHGPETKTQAKPGVGRN